MSNPLKTRSYPTTSPKINVGLPSVRDLGEKGLSCGSLVKRTKLGLEGSTETLEGRSLTFFHWSYFCLNSSRRLVCITLFLEMFESDSTSFMEKKWCSLPQRFFRIILAMKSIRQYRCKILTRYPKGGAFPLFAQPHHGGFCMRQHLPIAPR